MLQPHALLLILDGWGYSPEIEHNAIARTPTPNFDKLWTPDKGILLDASGAAVGLPDGICGNSEVGHLTLGAGQIQQQALERINNAIKDQGLSRNEKLQALFAHCLKSNQALQLIGLLSPGGVHAHEDHFKAILQLAKAFGLKKVYCHLFLDGRDTPPQSALASIKALQAYCSSLQLGQIASLSGRFYAMDRDANWDRTKRAYDALVLAQKGTSLDAQEALEKAYSAGFTDEFFPPQRLIFELDAFIGENSPCLCLNFRADRARQLLQALTKEPFDAFQTSIKANTSMIGMTDYGLGEIQALFPHKPLEGLSSLVADAGLRQLKLAETEKYAHVSYFFNGGRQLPYALEERWMVPSLKVTTFDQQPAMSARALTQVLIEAIKDQHYPLIVANYANADMVGHTGHFEATRHAIAILDQCLGHIIDSARAHKVGLFVTSDHGNADCLWTPSLSQAHTAHTLAPVPFAYTGPRPAKTCHRRAGLQDVAPTLLNYLGLAPARNMTGQTLLQWD